MRKQIGALAVFLMLAVCCCYTLQAQDMQEGSFLFSRFTPANAAVVDQELETRVPAAYQAHPEYGVQPFNATCTDCVELLQERTATGRTFIRRHTDGTALVRQEAYGSIHYKDEAGRWLTIDHRLHPAADGAPVYTAARQPVPVTIDLAEGHTTLTLAGGFLLRYQQRWGAYVANAAGEQVLHLGRPDRSRHTAGDDGVYITNAWPDMDIRLWVARSEVKTDVVLQQQPTGWPAGGYLVFTDTLELDPQLAVLPKGQTSWAMAGNEWYEGLDIRDAAHELLAEVHAPQVSDSNEEGYAAIEHPVHYRVKQENSVYILEVYTDIDWLMDPSRVYPVFIDPRVVGNSTYNAGDMAFSFTANCAAPNQYCRYPLTVTVPGKSTITHAWFDAEYYSKETQSCGTTQGVLCRKRDAGFRIEGPCGVSGPWACTQLNPITTIPGLCYGDSIVGDFPATVTCRPPSCPDHVLDFEMQNFHCSCITNACDTSCHVMRPGTWSVYVEARTLEGRVWQDALVCPGDTITLRAQGQWGVPPYLFDWQPGGATASLYDIAVDTPTTFVATITDQCGETVVDSARITIRPSPVVTLSQTNARCSSGSDGAATATGSGTQGPYSYSWNTSPPQNTATAANVSPGTYAVTVSDRYGCTVTDSIQVGYINLMDMNATILQITCFGFNDGSIALSPLGTAPFSYLWSTGDTTPQLQQLTPGIYSVTVTDAINCVDTLTIAITEPAPFTVDAGADQTLAAGSSVQLSSVVNPPGNYTYIWSPPTDLNDPTRPDPTASPAGTTVYTLQVAQQQQPDCFGIDTVTITVLPVFEIYVPSGFSPNGDGRNDLFLPTGQVEFVQIQVFNRWGELLYDGLTGWDGTAGGKPQPIGTYMYLITYRQPATGELGRVGGNVTLLR